MCSHSFSAECGIEVHRYGRVSNSCGNENITCCSFVMCSVGDGSLLLFGSGGKESTRIVAWLSSLAAAGCGDKTTEFCKSD